MRRHADLVTLCSRLPSSASPKKIGLASLTLLNCARGDLQLGAVGDASRVRGQ